MPRIRTVKPEFWTSGQVVKCDPVARLLFVGLWNFADDGGNHPADPLRLKMEVYPGDAFEVSEVAAWVGQLIDAGLIETYKAQGRTWWHVTGWDHQKIQHPTLRHPPPDRSGSTTGAIREASHNATGAIRDASPLDSLETDSMEGNVISSGDCARRSAVLPSLPSLKIKGGTPWLVPDEMFDQLRDAFPSLDVAAEVHEAALWCETNPGKRKTAAGMPRFLSGWMARTNNPKQPAGKTADNYAPVLLEE